MARVAGAPRPTWRTSRPEPHGSGDSPGQPRLFNPKLERWLHRINVPTHIIWGKDDRMIPPAYAEALKSLIPGATVTMMPGCAHLPHVEQPQAFAQRGLAIHPEGRAMKVSASI